MIALDNYCKIRNNFSIYSRIEIPAPQVAPTSTIPTFSLFNNLTFDALQSTMNKSLSVSQPNLAATSPTAPQAPKDEYRESLRQQIEEKKRQQELEKQKERETDELERKKFEAYQQRLQDEIDAEKAKHRRKLEQAKAQQV